VSVRAAAIAVVALVACGKSDKAPAPGSAHAQGSDEATGPVEIGPASSMLGEALFVKKGCISCHSIDGSAKIGPSIRGVAARALGGETRFTDGTAAKDLIGAGKLFPEVGDYLAAQTLRPRERVVVGYPPSAPAFDDILTKRDMDSLVLYMQSLD